MRIAASTHEPSWDGELPDAPFRLRDMGLGPRAGMRELGATLNELEERFSDGRISHLDGTSVDYDDWHFTVRPSNTEPLLRLTLESLVSEEDMERRRDEVLGVIRS